MTTRYAYRSQRLVAAVLALLALSACLKKRSPEDYLRLRAQPGAGAGGDSENSASAQAGMVGQGVEGGPTGENNAPSGLEGQGGEGATGNSLGQLAQGVACSSGEECESSFCVDGVCCVSSCGELCAACNEPGSEGTCSATSSDEACGELSCQGAQSDCRGFDVSQLSLNCEDFGLCRTQVECAEIIQEAGTACVEGSGECNGQGACVVPDKATLGDACETDEDCAEGHCVVASNGESVCCNSACDGPCQACGADGVCDEVPETDEACPPADCPADNLCRDYEGDILAGACQSFNRCRAARDCTFTELRSSTECACSESGDCALRVGVECEQDTDCETGACVETAFGTRVCCANGCGEGLVCSASGTGCLQCEGDQVGCEGDSQVRCEAGTLRTEACENGCTEGVGCNDLPPVGFLCSGQCAGNAVCAQDETGSQRCCVRDCAAEGKLCAENGSCVCAPGQLASGDNCLLEAGEPCQAGSDCQSNVCTDGVCCQESCNGACERCESGTGLCQALGAGTTDPGQCDGARRCMGNRGDCRTLDGQACFSGDGSDCASGNCEPASAGGNLCCAQACSGQRDLCQANGQACVECESNQQCGNGCNLQTGLCNPLIPVGSTGCFNSGSCQGNGVCIQDQFGQNRCCEQNCPSLGAGFVCNQQGQCVDPGVGPGQSCENRPCREGLTCTPEQICCNSQCSGACEDVCNLASGGQCRPASVAPICVNNNSASRTCQGTNVVDTPCPAGVGCNLGSGTCNSLIPVGQTGCNNAAQCAGSGSACVGGRCCEFDCEAAGRVCQTNGLCGCPGNRIEVNGACLLRLGEECNPNLPNQCAGAPCTTWYRDSDGDEHGNPNDTLSTCGDQRPTGYVEVDDDCCDANADVNPEQTTLFAERIQAGQCPGVLPFDYNCDDEITVTAPENLGITACNQMTLAECSGRIWSSPPGQAPACGQEGIFTACATSLQGVPTSQCASVTGGPLVNRCR